jgi:hypothetical protein
MWQDTNIWEDLAEDGGSMILQNTGVLPQHYATSQHRTRQLEAVMVNTICIEGSTKSITHLLR